MKKAIIIRQYNNLELPYNCQIWHQLHDSQIVYCGEGRYCDTFGNAVRWAKINGAEIIESKKEQQ